MPSGEEAVLNGEKGDPGPARYRCLAVNALEMVASGVVAYDQAPGYFLEIESGCDEAKDFDFTFGETGRPGSPGRRTYHWLTNLQSERGKNVRVEALSLHQRGDGGLGITFCRFRHFGIGAGGGDHTPGTLICELTSPRW